MELNRTNNQLTTESAKRKINFGEFCDIFDSRCDLADDELEIMYKDYKDKEFTEDEIAALRDEHKITEAFNSSDIEKAIPTNMRWKHYEDMGNELYWVTQQLFNEEDCKEFQEALKNTKFSKAYVTVRDLSTYQFDDDKNHNVFAIITPDNIDMSGYTNACKKTGLLEKKESKLQETPIENPNILDIMKLLDHALDITEKYTELPSDSAERQDLKALFGDIGTALDVATEISNRMVILPKNKVKPVKESDENKEDTTIIELYQVKPELTRDAAFMDFDFLRNNDKFSFSNYNKVADIPHTTNVENQSDEEILELVFMYGNSEAFHKDFDTARSVSVSDILKLHDKYYYCNAIGFTDITDEILNNNASVKTEEAKEDIDTKPEIETDEDRDKKIFQQIKDEPEPPKTAYDLIEDRIGQEMSVGEFNTILQSIFSKYNEVFLTITDLYNMDPEEDQEVIIFDDDDMYVITIRIKDLLEGTLEIVGVDIE